MPTPPVHRRSTTVWGVGAELSPFETVLWRAESDRSLRSSLLVIEQLDAEPAWDRLVAAHERLVARVPRLRQRIVEAPLDLGYPRWSPDRHFDLRQHLWRARLPVGVPGGCGWPGLLAAAARLAMAPVDRTRPPWEAVLFEGLPDGRAAYLLKIHHALTDGLGAVQLLEQLHVRTIDGDPAPAGDVRASAPQESPLGVLAHQVRSDVTAVPGLLRTAGSGALGALSNPRGALRSAGRYGSSLRRLAANMQVAPSPLLAGRGVACRFVALEVNARALRAAARTGGGTLHDGYLAALLGGYRRYHTALGRPVDTLPVGIPISMRRPGDPAGGNRITATRFAAPVSTIDPKERIEQVRALVLAARREPALDAGDLLFPTLARLPAALSTQLVGSLTRGNDLQASFVPGPRGDRYLAGTRVAGFYPFAPRPGCPAMITLVTHTDLACIGVNFDPAAFTRPGLFVRCLLDGFTEVLSLHPGAPTPTSRGF